MLLSCRIMVAANRIAQKEKQMMELAMLSAFVGPISILAQIFKHASKASDLTTQNNPKGRSICWEVPVCIRFL